MATPTVPPLESLLTETQAAPVIGVSPRTLQAWRVRGGGPPFVKAGRNVRYRPADLQAWMTDRTRTSTAQRV
jgi:excisionase family DNA binding protein